MTTDLLELAEQAKATVANWNRDHPNKPPFQYWAGGAEAPADWDGEEYLCRDGQTYFMRGYGWRHGAGCWNATADWDRIGYRARSISVARLDENRGKEHAD